MALVPSSSHAVVAVTAADSTITVAGTADTPTVAVGTIANANVAANAAIAISKLADPTTGKVIGSSASAAAAVFPPGFEIGYAQITSNANITDTAENTATALISSGSLTFDGTPVVAEFFCMAVAMPTAALTNTATITLFEGATQIGRLAQWRTDQTANQDFFQTYCAYRFTPTAAAHTYKICAFVSSTTGTPALVAGAGGTNTPVPAFLRFVKV